MKKEFKKYNFKYIENPDKFDRYEYNSHSFDAALADNGRIKKRKISLFILLMTKKVKSRKKIVFLTITE